MRRHGIRFSLAAGVAAVGSAASLVATAPPSSAVVPQRTSVACPPSAVALSYSDALDKKTVDGAEVGGLSAMAYDARRSAYAAIEDHSDGEATRVWFLKGVANPAATPSVVGTITLTKPDGSPYNDTNFDAEGLAVLPDGTYLVSSEVEPSIHRFDRTGKEIGTLPVPTRFHVPPTGQATTNATLEGLTISPDGRTIYAAMEGTLSGDVASDGNETYRRFLVYERRGTGYVLSKQIGYQVATGNRISEVQAYGKDGLLVMEAAWSEDVGNTVELYAVHTGRAQDVTNVADLGDSPTKVVRKAEVANVTKCPTLGAKAKETQQNPLMDNYEAMALVAPVTAFGKTPAEIMLLSDDNFNDTQTTRLPRLGALLP